MEQPNYYNIIYINSEDLIPGGNTSNFQINLQRPIENCKRLELLHCFIPNTIYNITTNNQNILFYDGTANRTATVPVGSYTSSQLLTALSTAFASSGTALTFSLSLNPNTFFLTISVSAGSFSLLFASGSNQMYDILGFQNLNYTSAASITGTRAYNVAYPTHILMRISEAGNSFNSSSTLNYATFVIPIDRNSSDIISYNKMMHFDQWAVLNCQTLTQLSIQLFDRNQVPISLNGSQWQLVLRAYN